jgi:hypothetical protein
MQMLLATALEKNTSQNEEATDCRLASLAKVGPLHYDRKHSTNTAQDTQWYVKYKIELFEGPTTFRLVQIDQHDQVTEEAVFSIQGILSAKNLPPVTEKIR